MIVWNAIGPSVSAGFSYRRVCSNAALPPEGGGLLIEVAPLEQKSGLPTVQRPSITLKVRIFTQK
jgi:hypothetical protein